MKNHSCHETCQSVEVSLVPPKIHKLNYLKMMFQQIFCRSIRHLEPETSANTQESKQHDLVDQEIEK